MLPSSSSQWTSGSPPLLPPVKKCILLSLDGGGNRGVSILYVLEEIVNRLKCDLGREDDPTFLLRDYVDLIAGTGTGGLIALMLGPLAMTIEDALSSYTQLFQEVLNPSVSLEHRAAKFEERLRQLVKDRFPHERNPPKMLSKKVQSPCKVFVCAAHKANYSFPRLFRTYPTRNHRSLNCDIWDAARATTASPLLFPPVDIGPAGQQQSFAQADLLCNNPAKEVLREVPNAFPRSERSQKVLISIGTGHPGAISRSDNQTLESDELGKLAYRIASDCIRTAQEVARLEQFHGSGDAYFRINVEQGFQDFMAEEWSVGDIASHTRAHLELEEIDSKVNQIVEVLTERGEQLQDMQAVPAFPSETISSNQRET